MGIATCHCQVPDGYKTPNSYFESVLVKLHVYKYFTGQCVFTLKDIYSIKQACFFRLLAVSNCFFRQSMFTNTKGILSEKQGNFFQLIARVENNIEEA